VTDDLHLLSPAGFAAAGVAAGLKRSGKLDLGLLVCTTDRPAVAAAAFSQNRVVSPTLTVGREHLADGRLRAVIVNSGNANACTGERGERDARETCRHLATHLGCEPEAVLPSSTGIIGHHLPMPTLLTGVDAVVRETGTTREHARAFEQAILTTDLVPKRAATRLDLDGRTVTIAGVTKGSGMIGPMLAVAGSEQDREAKQATMLAYVTTDADVPAEVLRGLLQPAVARTFNRTTVDGHPSTNDTCLVLASGASGVTVTPEHEPAFAAALTEVCDALAYQIAADGEGATKAVVVRVIDAASEAQAEALAMAIASSPLVKTALHGNDPNWGRIVSMAGMAAARDRLTLDPARCSLDICGTTVFRNGEPTDFDGPALSEQMRAKHLELVFDANTGLGGAAHVYTCDLSRDYIRINADYHT
jgi:glutamate N-acetyltransferase/amino-acid N-acetyltransferase